jgi:hypothetical protein
MAGKPMDTLGRICRCCVSEGVPRRSFVVAAIVGTILNLINQGDAMLAGMPLDLTKLLLTFLVPYCVSTYGAVSYRLHAERPAASGPASVLVR